MDIKQQQIHPLTNFALNYYHKICLNDNIFFSPASIYLALSLTGAGSSGKTLEEFKQVLQFQNLEEMGQLISNLSLKIQSVSQSFTISSANRIYTGISSINQNYRQFIEKYFQSGIQQVNFHETEAVRQEINKWVSTQTREKITELLAKDSIDGSTRMVLVNALYLKAEWLHKFDANKTNNQPFILNHEEKIIHTKMMMNEANYKYSKMKGFEYIQILYKNEAFAMEIFLPNGVVSELESIITPQIMQEAAQKAKDTKIKLAIPKFKMGGNSQSVKDVLTQIGLQNCFNGNANFSELCSSEPLFISDVIHSAIIEVNELGTEAAAATAVIVKRGSVPSQTLSVICNRPYIFTITHLPSCSILFLGKIQNPLNLQ